MKKTISICCLLFFITGLVYSAKIPKTLPGDGSRKRVYIIAGAGWAFSRVEGFTAEMGVELRLFGKVHARLMVDYYSAGRGIINDGVTIELAYGASLYALYKVSLSETWNLNLMAGGHYTTFNSEVSAFGIKFDTTESEKGVCGGLGFDWLLGNRWAFYTEGTLKYLMVSQPWVWGKVQMGVRFRVR